MPKKRTNGLSWPLDKAQVLSWLVIIYFGLATFASLCISLASPWIYLFTITSGFVFVIHVLLNIIVMAINPGEEVNLKRKIVPSNDFDRKKHKHVIENQFCNICQIVVSFKTKHCKRCNKCITHFDHHCIYLNNCIGGRNYRLFIFTIVSAFFGAFLLFFIGILEFSHSFTDNQTFLTTKYFNSECHNQTNCPDYLKAFPIFVPVNVNVWRAFTFINSALGLVVSGFIGYLIGYHVFLTFNKMTTYEHTIKLKHKADEKLRNRDTLTSSNTPPATTTKHSNSLAPPNSSQYSNNGQLATISNKVTSNGVQKKLLPVISEPPDTPEMPTRNVANNVKTTTAIAQFSNKAYDEFDSNRYDEENDYFQLNNQYLMATNVNSNVTHGGSGGKKESGARNEHSEMSKLPETTDLTCVHANGAINRNYVITSVENEMENGSDTPTNRSEKSEASNAKLIIDINSSKQHKLPRLLPIDWNKPNYDGDDDDVIISGAKLKV